MKRKYGLLFTPKPRGEPGPKGPSPELISAILEMKRRNPNFGYHRIADQIALAFEVVIDKDVVQRALARHYRSPPGSNGPTWLTFFGHSKDSLWRVYFFRRESLILKSHWVMVVMDQCNQRIVGFAAYAGALDVMVMKTVPYVPLSYPFFERLIGAARRAYPDQVPFRSARDRERKLISFQDYYNKDRIHRGLNGAPPNEQYEIMDRYISRPDNYR